MLGKVPRTFSGFEIGAADDTSIGETAEGITMMGKGQDPE